MIMVLYHTVSKGGKEGIHYRSDVVLMDPDIYARELKQDLNFWN